MPVKVLTELEGVVLGIVDAQQPCTAYRVRQGLIESPSTYWSASAGAIYPLIERLVNLGYVKKSARDRTDGRGRAMLSLSAKGRRSLHAWIMDAATPQVAASVFDSVRARAFFLESLSVAERTLFARQSLEALERFLDQTLEFQEFQKDAARFRQLAASGAVHAARARVAWMREVLADCEA